MLFNVRLRIDRRLGAGSRYNLRQVCVFLVDRYALTEAEVCQIVGLKPTEVFTNQDMEVTRIK